MEEYKVKDIISPIVDFIKTCPFAEEFGVNLDDVYIQRFEPGETDGSVVEYLGSNVVESASDILGNQEYTRQANFNLFLLKNNNRDIYNREAADFVANFEQWVEYCQVKGLTPKIGNDESEYDYELMYADNGNFFSNYENKDLSLYLLQLHIIYKNNY